MSKTAQNHSKTLFDIRCVSETLPERVWKDFGLPNGCPKEVLEASSRLSKTYSFQRGLPGRCQNGFWSPFGPLGARCLALFGDNFNLKIESEVCLSLLINEWQMLHFKSWKLEQDLEGEAKRAFQNLVYIYIYIYILESRARFARAQFSQISIWRPSPSLKGLGLHPEPEPRYSVMSARNLFLGAFGRATSCWFDEIPYKYDCWQPVRNMKRGRSKAQRKEATIAPCKSKRKSHQSRAGPAQHSMQCGSIADASGHECVMPGAKHRFWCKRSPLTNAMPPVKASASPRLHVETIYGHHPRRTDLKC